MQRFSENPLLTPSDIVPTVPGLVCECLLNPGAFAYGGRVGLLLRVAERPTPEDGWVSTPVLDPACAGGMRILRVRKDDADLVEGDPRVFHYKGRPYLTTLSHLRLAWSDDGVHFTVEDKPLLLGEGAYETFGIEDCRVEFSEGLYWLTYTAVSASGVAVGMISTADWKSFTRHGLIFPPHNKDCALFPEKIAGAYWALHRPSGMGIGGNYIWLARSPDRLHWGGHTCLAATRPGHWDSERVGGGAAPIRTERGWLAIYHGSDENVRYCLGLLLLDLNDPRRVLARSERPILEPEADYERRGFLGDVVFTNGHLVRGDDLTMYYGASDTVICAARTSVSHLLSTLP